MLTSLFLFWQAFTMIDQNRDGFIDVNDLKEMFSSLGKQRLSEPTSSVLSSWLCASYSRLQVLCSHHDFAQASLPFILYTYYLCLWTLLARERMKWQFGRLLSESGVYIAARANSISISCVVPCTNHYHMHSLSASGTRPNSSQIRTWHWIFSIITKPIKSLYWHIITLCRAEITLYYANQHFCSSSELKYFQNGGFSSAYQYLAPWSKEFTWKSAKLCNSQNIWLLGDLRVR